MTKYQYEEGKVYTSESEPITINRIPSGTYKIQAVNGTGTGWEIITVNPGIQTITIEAFTSDWDLSGLYMDNTGIIGGISGTTPVDSMTVTNETKGTSVSGECTASDFDSSSTLSNIIGISISLSVKDSVIVELFYKGVSQGSGSCTVSNHSG